MGKRQALWLSGASLENLESSAQSGHDPSALDLHPKVKERALDLSLPMRRIRRNDSSSMAPGGKVEGQARGNASGVLGRVCCIPGWGPSLRLGRGQSWD